MSDFFGKLYSGVREPEIVMGEGPLPPTSTVGMPAGLNGTPDGRINMSQTLLGDVDPYAYGEPDRLSTQTSYTNVPHHAQRIIPEMTLPGPQTTRNNGGTIQLTHQVMDGDVAFVIRAMFSPHSLVSDKKAFARQGVLHAIDPICSLSTVNYILHGLQRFGFDAGNAQNWHLLWTALGIDDYFTSLLVTDADRQNGHTKFSDLMLHQQQQIDQAEAIMQYDPKTKSYATPGNVNDGIVTVRLNAMLKMRDYRRMLAEYLIKHVITPFGVPRGSDKQGGQHQASNGNRSVTWPVDFVTSLLIDGKCINLLNFWKGEDISAGDSLLLHLVDESATEYTLSHHAKSRQSPRFPPLRKWEVPKCVADSNRLNDRLCNLHKRAWDLYGYNARKLKDFHPATAQAAVGVLRGGGGGVPLDKGPEPAPSRDSRRTADISLLGGGDGQQADPPRAESVGGETYPPRENPQPNNGPVRGTMVARMPHGPLDALASQMGVSRQHLNKLILSAPMNGGVVPTTSAYKEAAAFREKMAQNADGNDVLMTDLDSSDTKKWIAKQSLAPTSPSVAGSKRRASSVYHTADSTFSATAPGSHGPVMPIPGLNDKDRAKDMVTATEQHAADAIGKLLRIMNPQEMETEFGQFVSLLGKNARTTYIQKITQINKMVDKMTKKRKGTLSAAKSQFRRPVVVDEPIFQLVPGVSSSQRNQVLDAIWRHGFWHIARCHIQHYKYDLEMDVSSGAHNMNRGKPLEVTFEPVWVEGREAAGMTNGGTYGSAFGRDNMDDGVPFHLRKKIGVFQGRLQVLTKQLEVFKHGWDGYHDGESILSVCKETELDVDIMVLRCRKTIMDIDNLPPKHAEMIRGTGIYQEFERELTLAMLQNSSALNTLNRLARPDALVNASQDHIMTLMRNRNVTDREVVDRLNELVPGIINSNTMPLNLFYDVVRMFLDLFSTGNEPAMIQTDANGNVANVRQILDNILSQFATPAHEPARIQMDANGNVTNARQLVNLILDQLATPAQRNATAGLPPTARLAIISPTTSERAEGIHSAYRVIDSGMGDARDQARVSRNMNPGIIPHQTIGDDMAVAEDAVAVVHSLAEIQAETQGMFGRAAALFRRRLRALMELVQPPDGGGDEGDSGSRQDSWREPRMSENEPENQLRHSSGTSDSYATDRSGTSDSYPADRSGTSASFASRQSQSRFDPDRQPPSEASLDPERQLQPGSELSFDPEDFDSDDLRRSSFHSAPMPPRRAPIDPDGYDASSENNSVTTEGSRQILAEMPTKPITLKAKAGGASGRRFQKMAANLSTVKEVKEDDKS